MLGWRPRVQRMRYEAPPRCISSIGGSCLRLCASPEAHAYDRVDECPASRADLRRTVRSDRAHRVLASDDATAGLRDSARVPEAFDCGAFFDTFRADAAVRVHPVRLLLRDCETALPGPKMTTRPSDS